MSLLTPKSPIKALYEIRCLARHWSSFQMNNHHFRAAVQLLGENPRCQQLTKCNFVGGNLGHIPAVTSESCGCCHSHSHGDQGPGKRDLSAWDKQSSWKSFCSLFTSKKPLPFWCALTQGVIFCAVQGSHFWAAQLTRGSPAAPTSRPANLPARMKRKCSSRILTAQ